MLCIKWIKESIPQIKELQHSEIPTLSSFDDCTNFEDTTRSHHSSSGSFTDDTLKMISTPWVTDSSESDCYDDCLSSSLSDTSSTSLLTRSPTFTTTLTLMEAVSSWSTSPYVKAEEKQFRSPDSSDSWTWETYTESELEEVGGKVLEVKYPWSPKSGGSSTDVYPSSDGTDTEGHSLVSL